MTKEKLVNIHLKKYLLKCSTDIIILLKKTNFFHDFLF